MASTKLTEGEAWVERIMGQKRKGKNMLFRIKWEKDPTTTWEPFENVYVSIAMQIKQLLKA